MTWLLRARALGARAGGDQLLGPIDLDLHPGERVAVVGRSGAGKTQLVETLLDLPRPDVRRTGTVEWSPSSRPDSGLLAQESAQALDPLTRTGRQLRAAGGRRHGGVAGRLGLGPALLRRHPPRLSGGQRRRAALALAMARCPRLLVADEPTTGLDEDTRASTLDVLAEELDRTRTALLLVTHDLAAARLLCTRVLVIDDGLVVESGSVAGVLTTPASPAAAALVEASRVLGDTG